MDEGSIYGLTDLSFGLGGDPVTHEEVVPGQTRVLRDSWCLPQRLKGLFTSH